MNTKIMEALFPNETKNISVGKCPFCSNTIQEDEFRNVVSKKEFSISGLCQNCQDDIFGND